jgi:hypothetical protein
VSAVTAPRLARLVAEIPSHCTSRSTPHRRQRLRRPAWSKELALSGLRGDGPREPEGRSARADVVGRCPTFESPPDMGHPPVSRQAPAR